MGPTRVHKLVRAGLIAAAALLFLLGGAAGTLLHQFWTANTWIQHTTDVIAEVRTLRTHLGLAADAGSKPENIRASMAALREQTDRVAESTRDNAWQQKNVADFRRLTTAVTSDGKPAPLSPDRLEAANTVLDRMQREEYGLLLQRGDREQRAFVLSTLASFVFVLALLAAAIVSAAIARRQVRLRHAAEEILQKETLELTRYGKELAVVSTGSELIQAAQSEEFMLATVAQVLQELLPGASGFVGLVDAAQDRVHVKQSWGDETAPESFPAATCIALQIGRPVHRANALHAACEHASNSRGDTLCVPVRSACGHLGVLHVRATETLAQTSADSVGLFAAHVALGLTNLRMRESLRNQSVRDSLTGLFNRRYFDDALKRELTKAAHGGSPLSVLLFDLDHFKACNDTHGHVFGDRVLQSFAKLLASAFPESDVVCRYGGEEFAVILAGTDVRSAYTKAESFREVMEQTDLGASTREGGRLTTSAGVACSREFKNAEELVSAADTALYDAKRAGRNRVCMSSGQAQALQQ